MRETERTTQFVVVKDARDLILKVMVVQNTNTAKEGNGNKIWKNSRKRVCNEKPKNEPATTTQRTKKNNENEGVKRREKTAK